MCSDNRRVICKHTAGGFSRQIKSFTLWWKYMKARRNILSVSNIMLTDEMLCRLDNWSAIRFADLVLFINTTDKLCWMAITDCVVQLVIDNWTSHNAKKCTYFCCKTLPTTSTFCINRRPIGETCQTNLHKGDASGCRSGVSIRIWNR